MNDLTPEAAERLSSPEFLPTEFAARIPRTGPLAAILAIHLLVLVIVLVMGPKALGMMSLFPFVTAGINLLACWLMLGQARLVYRIGGALAYCGALMSTTLRDPQFATLATVVVGMQFVCVAAPLFVLATLGFAISMDDPSHAPSGNLRYRIRDLVVWTVAAACLLSVGSYAAQLLSTEIDAPHFALLCLVATILMGWIALLCIWVMLTTTSLARRMTIFVVGAALWTVAVMLVNALEHEVQFLLTPICAQAGVLLGSVGKA